jgi:hypothetical protein
VIELNINDWVSVKLNDIGRDRHRADFDRWTANLQRKPEYRAPKEDAEGWSKWQLWHLMEIFGPLINLGAIPPFETTIRVKEGV